MKKSKKREIRLIIVISGQSREMVFGHDIAISHLISRALLETGNHGASPYDWELRSLDGLLIDQSKKIGELGLRDKQMLFLAPRAGVGGSIKAPHYFGGRVEVF